MSILQNHEITQIDNTGQVTHDCMRDKTNFYYKGVMIEDLKKHSNGYKRTIIPLLNAIHALIKEADEKEYFWKYKGGVYPLMAEDVSPKLWMAKPMIDLLLWSQEVYLYKSWQYLDDYIQEEKYDYNAFKPYYKNIEILIGHEQDKIYLGTTTIKPKEPLSIVINWDINEVYKNTRDKKVIKT